MLGQIYRLVLTLVVVPVAWAAHAACVTDPPEIGDIGPDSELVCQALEQRFPNAALAVVGRSVHSPTQVSVAASVDGRPLTLPYTLMGYAWRLREADPRTTGGPKTPGQNAL